MNIVYASDDNFAEMLGISMISLFENNKDCDKIDIYILDDNISEKNRKNILSIVEVYKRNIEFISVDNIEVPKEVQSVRWSKSAFTRLYLRQLLPDNIDKVLYLDCDTIIISSLINFYNMDLCNYYAAGVRDCVSKHYLKNLNLDETDCYFNSGVLLINLNKWNEEEFTSFFLSHSKVIKYPDQDVINGVCGKNVIITDLKYNCYTALYDFTYKNLLVFRKPIKYYSKQEVILATKSPTIVHFTTSFLSIRPWIEECKHPYVSEWLKYKAMSPWKDVLIRKDNRSSEKKLFVKIYSMLPNAIAIRIIGLLHSIIIPFLKRV